MNNTDKLAIGSKPQGNEPRCIYTDRQGHRCQRSAHVKGEHVV